MNADLERLIALQKLDTTADEARKKLAGEPEHEQALEARLDAARQHVAAAKEQLPANKNARAALEKDVAVQQGRLSKFRETAMAVKTNQEYHAVQHEITFAQAEIKKIEDAILERMMESDELAAALKTAEAQLAAETKAVEAERRAGRAAHAEMEASLERIAVERGALIAGLNKDVLATFEAVARKRNGVAMSEARGRHLHHLPRPTPSAGVQQRAAERLDPAVRSLQPDPVLRARAGVSRDRTVKPLAAARVVTLRRRSGQPSPRQRAGQLPFDGHNAPQRVVAYIDGGARGNPGPAGFGVRVEQSDGTLIEEFAESIGVATNNVAEYRALLAALEWARRHGRDQLHVRSDSLLLVQQMLGNYKVKNAGLQPLHAKARVLAHEIGGVTFEHVGRSLNAHADRLANTAMDDAAAR